MCVGVCVGVCMCIYHGAFCKVVINYVKSEALKEALIGILWQSSPLMYFLYTCMQLVKAWKKYGAK